jgi:hypothetical protein
MRHILASLGMWLTRRFGSVRPGQEPSPAQMGGFTVGERVYYPDYGVIGKLTGFGDPQFDCVLVQFDPVGNQWCIREKLLHVKTGRVERSAKPDAEGSAKP